MLQCSSRHAGLAVTTSESVLDEQKTGLMYNAEYTTYVQYILTARHVPVRPYLGLAISSVGLLGDQQPDISPSRLLTASAALHSGGPEPDAPLLSIPRVRPSTLSHDSVTIIYELYLDSGPWIRDIYQNCS